MSEHRMPGCPHRELAVGWALHALEPAEEALFAAHLPTCVECGRTVRATEEVGVALAVVVPDVRPDDELGRRVLAGAGSNEAAPVVSLHEHRERRRRPAGRVFAAAAAVVLVAGSAVLGVRVVQLDGQRDQAAQRAAQLQQVIGQAADPDLSRVPLVTPDGQPMGVVLAGDGAVTVVPTAMAENSLADQVYVLWGLGRGEPVPVQSFDVSPDVALAHTVGSSAGAEAFTGYAVSLEPGRTPPASPSEVLASGQVDS